MSPNTTGLLNRNGWDRVLALEGTRSRRYGGPACVMVLDLDVRLHGFFHTLLFGGLTGLAWGLIGFRLRHFFSPLMAALRLPYRPSLQKALLSGLAGAWLHLLFDTFLYGDMRPLYPLPGNPLLGTLSPSLVYNTCLLCLPLALALWLLPSRPRST